MDIILFRKDMNYFMAASNDCQCRKCRGLITRGDYIFLRLENNSESHYCYKCGSHSFDLRDNLFSYSNRQLRDKMLQIIDIDYRGIEAIYSAVRRNDEDQFRRITEKHRDAINLKRINGEHPLHFAARIGANKVIQILLESGASTDPRDARNNTPLMMAILGNQMTAMKTLIANYADVNARNDQGKTPAYIAVEKSSLQSLELLMDAGADLKIADIEGVNAFELARRIKNRYILEYLDSLRVHDQ